MKNNNINRDSNKLERFCIPIYMESMIVTLSNGLHFNAKLFSCLYELLEHGLSINNHTNMACYCIILCKNIYIIIIRWMYKMPKSV